MQTVLPLRIILEKPPAGVDFALQEGKGGAYRPIQTQQSDGGDLTFDCTMAVKDNREDGQPSFLGPLIQGPPTDRFIYFDIGQFAGQKDSPWNRRLKIPLGKITWQMIRSVAADPRLILETRVPGTDKRGGPICAKLKDVKWKAVRREGG
jgi:hypothetical protein